MQKQLDLPEYLFPHKTDNLIRIGNTSDGSYLVDRESILDTDILLSIGVGIIFEFEKKFLKLKKVPILAFDESAGLLSQLRKIKWRFMQILKLKDFNYIRESVQFFLVPFKFYFFYKNFRNTRLNNNYRRFIKKFVGTEKGQITISEIVDKFELTSRFNNIFFQIDIEGGEYKILYEIIEFQDYISGLVIEFHNIDQHLTEIERFISEFKLNLVHTHVNNIGGISKENFPKVIELTFSKFQAGEKTYSLPHPLDEPNSNNYFDYIIKYKD